jgi:peptidoglycan/LPS O-acetylase OafA/YrhL
LQLVNVLLVIIPATIVFAWVFFWFCEKPFMVRRAPAAPLEPVPALTVQPSTAGD